MVRKAKLAMGEGTLGREVGQGLLLLAISGSSVGGLVGMLAVATRVLGR
ncbi:MAG: hypothetical protein ACLGHL_00440 [Actinomycetota bacterium]